MKPFPRRYNSRIIANSYQEPALQADQAFKPPLPKVLHFCTLMVAMKMHVYPSLLEKKKTGKKSFAVLIDPDKVSAPSLNRIIHLAVEARVDYFSLEAASSFLIILMTASVRLNLPAIYPFCYSRAALPRSAGMLMLSYTFHSFRGGMPTC